MNRNQSLIELRNVSVQRDGTTILDDCTWRVMPGENWVLFGPNGAGKTSILNVLQGYLWPTAGKAIVFGGTLGDGVDVRRMRRQIPVVSEAIRRLINEGLTGREVIVTGDRGHLNIFSPVTAEERQRAEDMAARTSLTGLLDKPFGVMSTGERQRILMARALMPRPRIMVLDEPCAGLDLAGREWVLQLMETISGLPEAPALLLTTHHAEEIAPVFDHGLLLREGRIHAAGKLADVFTSENLSRLFDVPLRVTQHEGRWMARLG